ncbi:MAG: hypothetical protein BWY31_03719 [Lentisphaerae bacterium ADurb.Bin242]|nr:MAG: hypothetical protein BWY31_03719 [Lentisphaerae bacterium ADurb.Bin242]
MKAFRILLLFYISFPAAGTEIVKDGIAKASIVIPKDSTPVEKFAAEELSSYIGKITGARLETGFRSGMLPIRIGLAEADSIVMTPALREAAGNIRENGFVIESGPDGVQIVAKKPRGLLYGTYFLLKKFGSVYWFHPDEDEFVPSEKNFIIPDRLIVKNPAFRFPDFPPSAFSLPARLLWRIRNGLQFEHVRIGDPKIPPIMEMKWKLGPTYGTGGHHMTNLLVGYYPPGGLQKTRERLFSEHPEFFGMKNGVRVLCGDDLYLKKQPVSQPCTSNPEVLKRMVLHMQEVIDREFKDQELTWRFLNDDHTHWCECENCRKLDNPAASADGRRSDRWWTFVNAMAKEMLEKNPKLHFKVMAYQDFRSPPTRVKPDPRVTVVICPHGRCYVHSLADPSCPVNASIYRRMFEEWHRAGAKIGTFEYHTQCPGKSVYIPFERAWVEDLKYYKSLDADGFALHLTDGEQPYYKHPYYETYRYRNMWLSNWQLAWLTGHFAWNIDDDFDKVWEDVNSKYYGPAWKYMKEYRQLLEKTMLDSGVHMGYGISSTVQSLGKCYEQPGLAVKVKKLLDQAENTAKNSSVHLRRVARDREYFRTNWEEAGFSTFKNFENTVKVRRAENPIVIDGVLDENDWIRAEWAGELNSILSGGGKEKAHPGAKVKLLHDGGNLYIAVEAMKERGKTIDVAAENGLNALRGSRIELFLVPPALKGKYYHLGIAHNGKTFSALTTDGRTRDPDKQIPFRFKIKDLPDRWIAEVMVPAAEMGSIEDGDCWKINIGRSAANESGASVNSSWSGGGFHALEYFKVICFGAVGPVILNGDFEDLGKPPVPVPDKWGGKWEFLSEGMPLKWSYPTANSGKAEVRSDDPASGKYYLRMNSVKKSAILSQPMRITDNAVKRFFISMKLKGKGVVVPAIYCNGRYYREREFAVGNETWTFFSAVIECPVPGTKSFYLKFYSENIPAGIVDVDDVRITPAADGAMPDVMKHH